MNDTRKHNIFTDVVSSRSCCDYRNCTSLNYSDTRKVKNTKLINDEPVSVHRIPLYLLIFHILRRIWTQFFFNFLNIQIVQYDLSFWAQFKMCCHNVFFCCCKRLLIRFRVDGLLEPLTSKEISDRKSYIVGAFKSVFLKFGYFFQWLGKPDKKYWEFTKNRFSVFIFLYNNIYWRDFNVRWIFKLFIYYT